MAAVEAASAGIEAVADSLVYPEKKGPRSHLVRLLEETMQVMKLLRAMEGVMAPVVTLVAGIPLMA